MILGLIDKFVDYVRPKDTKAVASVSHLCIFILAAPMIAFTNWHSPLQQRATILLTINIVVR